QAGRRRICPQAVHRRSNQGEAGGYPGTRSAPMNLHQFIVDSINRAVSNVFATMLGWELGPGTDSVAVGSPDTSDGVVSLVGIAGTWAGTGSLTCSSAMACAMCSQMLTVKALAVDEEVLDAVAELTNM